MFFWQAIILGIVQGITEFFPVSSSAHLNFVRHLLGIEGNWLYFDLACHAGTWLALAYFLRREILATLCSVRQIALFTLALIPLVPAYFLLKPLFSSFSPGYFLLATSLLLFLASRTYNLSPKKTQNVIFIGTMQAMALLPGLSRSGSTIAAARFCGWQWLDAARFSFLLAVPTILGGEILESYKIGFKLDEMCLVGFLTSFVVGLLAVRFVFRIYERGIVKPFAWYCLGFGLLILWLKN